MIALVDCNSFFCSCERLFRPDLKNVPVIVLSNNDGCAIARTNEAKRLGIKMGDPYFKIRDLCKEKGVAVFSSNFSLYTNVSDRVMRTLATLTPTLQIYSVDEAFLCLEGIRENELADYGRHIKETIEKEVGIPVSVGIAPTKTMAKIANFIGKRSDKAKGVVVLNEKRLQDIALERVGVSDIWGIGRANAKKLESLGIKNAKQFRDYKNETYIKKILTKVGLQTKQELAGISCFPIEIEIEKKKEIMCSRSFGQGVFDLSALKESVANYVSSAAEKLRKQGSVCRRIDVFFRTSPFKDNEQYYAYDTYQFLTATLDTRKLIEKAIQLVETNYRSGFEYKKAGVRLCDIIEEDENQISLFEQADSLLSEQLMKTIDQVNLREGPQMIRSASCGVDNNAWKMLREHKSPRYTTSWRELPKVK